MKTQNLAIGKTPDEGDRILKSSKAALLQDQHDHGTELGEQLCREGLFLELNVVKMEGLERRLERDYIEDSVELA